jgi:hypothetical protein
MCVFLCFSKSMSELYYVVRTNKGLHSSRSGKKEFWGSVIDREHQVTLLTN